MSEAKENPSALLAEDARGKTTESNLQGRLIRYADLKVKSDRIADYLTLQPDLPAYPGIAGVIQSCGDFLQFRNYYEIDEIRLHRANFCGYHMLCPFCAMRRGVKYSQLYGEKIDQVLKLNPGLKIYHVVLTIKNGPVLKERFKHVESSITKMLLVRRNANKGLRSEIEFNKALGGVFSFEIKRGQGSKEWHPHIHCLILAYEEISMIQLSREWLEITGDSINVFVEECQGDLVTSGLEVFAYALKFSTMAREDIWNAYKILRGKRFIRSFGCLRGVPEPDTLADDPIKDQPYYDMLYQFFYNTSSYKLKLMDIEIRSIDMKQETEIL